MEEMKKLVKYSMKLLNEADEYADCYVAHMDNPEMKDIYYSLASGHLDMYNKVRNNIMQHVSRLRVSEPESHADVIWNFIKDTEDDFLMRIRNKIK